MEAIPSWNFDLGGENNMDKVKVIFRKVDTDVVAFFPELPANYTCIMSYMHIGQHAEASMGFYHESKVASESEYASLLEELKKVYSDCELIVRKRLNYHDLVNKAWK